MSLSLAQINNAQGAEKAARLSREVASDLWYEGFAEIESSVESVAEKHGEDVLIARALGAHGWVYDALENIWEAPVSDTLPPAEESKRDLLIPVLEDPLELKRLSQWADDNWHLLDEADRKINHFFSIVSSIGAVGIVGGDDLGDRIGRKPEGVYAMEHISVVGRVAWWVGNIQAIYEGIGIELPAPAPDVLQPAGTPQ